MAWYRSGSITVTNGSVTVSGAGTAWISNAAIGEALYAPDGRLYEIVNIASDTTITLQSAYLGATASAQAYVIVPSQSYIRDLAAQAADLVNNYSTIYNTVGQGKFGDGTLGAPGIRFSDDLDTGFYRSASNEVTFVAGGTAIFKYSLTGGLSLTTGGALVGTTATQTLTNKTLTAPVLGGTVTGTYTLGGTPTFPSSVVLTTGAQTLASKTLTNPVINGFTGDTSIINIGSGQVYKDASGNVGIGTQSPVSALHVYRTAADAVATVQGLQTASGGTGKSAIQLDVNGKGGFAISNDSTSGTRALTFSNNSGYGVSTVEAMRIDSSNNVSVSAASAYLRLKSASTNFDISGQAGGNDFLRISANGTQRFQFNDLGAAYNSTGTWGTISDVRLKENIVESTPKLEGINQLRVVNFNLKSDPDVKQIGFIAQEVEQIFPGLVSNGEEDGEGGYYKAVKTTVLIPMLVKAIQELKAEFDAYKAAHP